MPPPAVDLDEDLLSEPDSDAGRRRIALAAAAAVGGCTIVDASVVQPEPDRADDKSTRRAVGEAAEGAGGPDDVRRTDEAKHGGSGVDVGLRRRAYA